MSKKKSPFTQPVIPQAESHRQIEEYTAAAQQAFWPFVRRKRILTERREILRTELVNLCKILRRSEYEAALLQGIRLCRKGIDADSLSSHRFRALCFLDIATADAKWLGLCSGQKDMSEASKEDQASSIFRELLIIAEGCIKPRLSLLYGFATHSNAGGFPSEVPGFGTAACDWPATVAPHLHNLLRDPRHGVAISQWRNIAAHQSYVVVGDGVFEATIGGKKKRSFRFALDDLEEVRGWAIDLTGIVRMAELIVMLEYTAELKAAGIPDVPLRFDAWMIGLAHNLRMVGFTYLHEDVTDRTLVLCFIDDIARPARDAIIHVSQILPSLAHIVSEDPSIAKKFDATTIKLLRDDGRSYAQVTGDISRALLYGSKQMDLKEYLDGVAFAYESEVFPNDKGYDF